MVGGTVKNVIVHDDRVTIVSEDRELGYSGEVSIDIKPTKNVVQEGDYIWWQGEFAYWTPQNGSQSDVPLPRIGYSYRSA